MSETTGFDLLLNLTDPALVTFEMDTGWVAAAGRDPVRYLEDPPGRFRLMHAKDLKPSPPSTNLEMVPADLGQGRLDWKAIFAAAKASGLHRYYVEQEPPFPNGQLASAKANFAFVSSL